MYVFLCKIIKSLSVRFLDLRDPRPSRLFPVTNHGSVSDREDVPVVWESVDGVVAGPRPFCSGTYLITPIFLSPRYPRGFNVMGIECVIYCTIRYPGRVSSYKMIHNPF